MGASVRALVLCLYFMHLLWYADFNAFVLIFSPFNYFYIAVYLFVFVFIFTVFM